MQLWLTIQVVFQPSDPIAKKLRMKIAVVCFIQLAAFVFEPPIALADENDPFVVILGNAQDAGYPQSNCNKACCKQAWKDHSKRRFATSIAVVDPQSKSKILFECTPNFPDQIHQLNKKLGRKVNDFELSGIFLTHAHIGHYSGLIHLGREVEGASGTPVYVMPRMREFLIKNGPWSQLVELKNISLRRLTEQHKTTVGRIEVTPILVPHRDEFSETVGFRIQGPNQSILFVPDIDKWEKWKTNIESEIAKVDVALLDGTFYDGKELPGRDMSKIPHPFVVETVERFEKLPKKEKTKVYFIHLNHTNRLLDKNSNESIELRRNGFKVAEQGQEIKL